MTEERIPYTIDDISAKEKHLIIELRKVRFGNVTIFMQEFIPIRIEKVRESIVL